MRIFVITVIVLGIVVFSPFVTIWSLNTLFSLDIAYDVWTWLAVVWLTLFAVGPLYRRKDEK
jgi:hypothetical protein